MSSPIEQFRETAEQHGHEGRGPRWIPIAAAVLAVLAAISGFLGNLRATSSLTAKNDAVIATTRAADAWNEFEADSIKQHIYEAAIVAGRSVNAAKLSAVVESEKRKKGPIAAKAHGLEHEAEADNARSERLLQQHEYFEIGSALFEVAIVLVSITALAGSRLLPVMAALATVVGLISAGIAVFA